MSLLIVGTVPVEPGRLYHGAVTRAADGSITVGDDPLPECQGTAALLMAAHAVTLVVDFEVHALLGGDVGRGDGTRAVYDALPEEVERTQPTVLGFHYLQPVMALMRRGIEQLEPRLADGMRLVADAGGMYAARASGVGRQFELMTPDVGEVGFLADETVSHPAYVSHFLFGANGFDPVALARKAQQGASARVLLVKGETDHVVERGEVRGTISDPMVPALEAIGGTGDTLTGLASSLMTSGMDTVDAAILAARTNREAGRLLDAEPYHAPADLVGRIPEALTSLM